MRDMPPTSSLLKNGGAARFCFIHQGHWGCKQTSKVSVRSFELQMDVYIEQGKGVALASSATMPAAGQLVFAASITNNAGNALARWCFANCHTVNLCATAHLDIAMAVDVMTGSAALL